MGTSTLSDDDQQGYGTQFGSAMRWSLVLTAALIESATASVALAFHASPYPHVGLVGAGASSSVISAFRPNSATPRTNFKVGAKVHIKPSMDNVDGRMRGPAQPMHMSAAKERSTLVHDGDTSGPLSRAMMAAEIKISSICNTSRKGFWQVYVYETTRRVCDYCPIIPWLMYAAVIFEVV